MYCPKKHKHYSKRYFKAVNQKGWLEESFKNELWIEYTKTSYMLRYYNLLKNGYYENAVKWISKTIELEYEIIKFKHC